MTTPPSCIAHRCAMLIAQAPAMGTLWTLTIVQLPLDRAVLCLILVGGWTWYSGLSLQPR